MRDPAIMNEFQALSARLPMGDAIRLANGLSHHAVFNEDRD